VQQQQANPINGKPENPKPGSKPEQCAATGTFSPRNNPKPGSKPENPKAGLHWPTDEQQIQFEQYTEHVPPDKALISVKLLFKQSSYKSAHILQVPAMTDNTSESFANVHLIRYFVEKGWKLPRPEVLISVIGGDGNFDLSPEHKDRMMWGMMEGTRHLNPWFITGGTNSGIMKYVGEARAKYNPKAPLIGIISSPAVAGGQQLRRMYEKATRQTRWDCKRKEKQDEKLPEQWPTYNFIQAGVGIVVELSKDPLKPNSRPFECRITGPRKSDNGDIDCPGIKAGRLKINDAIVSIDSLPVAGLKLAQIEKALRGVKGSEVTLKIRRPGLGDTHQVVLTRHVEDEKMCREFQQNLSGVAGCWFEKASPSGGKGAADQGHSQMSYEDLVRLELEFDKKVNPVHLDPNHSHFIFIDEGKKGSGSDRAFRSVFEACISDAPNFRYPIYQLQSLRSQKKPESALVCILRRDAEIERYTGDFAKPKSALDCIRRDAEIEIYDSCRVLKVEMAGARSALQALFMREEGWGVDDLSDMTKKNTKEPTYWCEGVNKGVVCSALQAIWLHAGIGSQETRSKGRLAFAEAMNIKAVDERIKTLRKALQDQIEAKHSPAVGRGRTHDVCGLRRQVADLEEEYKECEKADIAQAALTFSRKIIGERLYMRIQALDHKLIEENATLVAGKVTGMLLESLDLCPLATLVENRAELQKKVEELVPELEQRFRSGAPGTVYGSCGPLAIFGPRGGPKGYLSQEEKNSNTRSGPGKLTDSKYAAFLCHDRGKDSQGRDNHARVMLIKQSLARLGVQTWVDDEEMKGDIDTAACKGIDESGMVLLFITKRFMEKVGGDDERDFCRLEFNYAKGKKTAKKMLCVVMEPELKNPTDWKGAVNMHMGSRLWFDFTTDDEFEAKVGNLLKMMQKTTGGELQDNKSIVQRLLKEKEKQLSSRLKLSGYLKTLEDHMADLHQECKIVQTTEGSGSFNFEIEEEANIGDVQDKREGILQKLRLVETAFMFLEQSFANFELGKLAVSGKLDDFFDQLDGSEKGWERLDTFLRFCFLEKLFLGNKISKDELESAEKAENLSVSKKLGDFFDQLDTDQDGFISKDELEAAQKNLSSQVDFYKFDRDWVGNISKEFAAASASLHNVDQVLNERCIERILSESAEHTKKMQKSNDATKKHADANKLLNESIAIHDQLKLDNHAEEDQKQQLDLEDKALKFLKSQATYEEKMEINAIKHDNAHSLMERLEHWRKMLMELVDRYQQEVEEARADMGSIDAIEANSTYSTERLALWREGERLVLVTMAGLKSQDESQRKSFFCKLKNISPVSARFVQEELHKEKERRAAQRQNKDEVKEEIITVDEEGKESEIFLGETGIPLVSVCIQGDADTVDTVLQGCRAGTRTLLVRGSGKAADLLSDAVLLQHSPSHPSHVKNFDVKQTAFWNFIKLCGIDPNDSLENETYDWTKARDSVKRHLEKFGEYERALKDHKTFDFELVRNFFEKACQLVAEIYNVGPNSTDIRKCLDIINQCLEVAVLQKCFVYDLLSLESDKDDFNAALLKCLLNGVAKPGEESAQVLLTKLQYAMLWSRDDPIDNLLNSMSERIDDKQREDIFNRALLMAMKKDKVHALSTLIHRGIGLNMLDVGHYFCYVQPYSRHCVENETSSSLSTLMGRLVFFLGRKNKGNSSGKSGYATDDEKKTGMRNSSGLTGSVSKSSPRIRME